MFSVASLPLILNLGIFVVLATAIWLAGTRLAWLADMIGDRTGISRALMGLIFLAGITELPELVTTVTAAVQGDAVLALNNMFGGIVMQTAVLAIADAFVVHAVLTAFPRKPTPILEGLLLILLLTAILAVIALGETSLIQGIGLGTVLVAGIYGISILILRHYDSSNDWRPVNLPGLQPGLQPDQQQVESETRDKSAPPPLPMPVLIRRTIASALVILVCGVMMVEVSQALAVQTGLGSSFIGVTLLAASTSLPELSTTIAAVRIGAYTMAISNIFGSNLIMVLVLFPADIFYRQGEILREAGATAQLALLSGILVTTIYVVGLVVKKKPRLFGMGIDSILVLLIYAASLYAFYQAGLGDS